MTIYILPRHGLDGAGLGQTVVTSDLWDPLQKGTHVGPGRLRTDQTPGR